MLMLHTKLLLRRLAYVPWLLTVGLVLGWSGESVADPVDRANNNNHANLPANHDHSTVLNHTHATDPYLRVSYALDTRPTGQPEAGLRDSVFVSWSTAYSKNFNQPKTTTMDGNGTEASTYVLTFHKGETPGSGVVQGSGSLTTREFRVLDTDTPTATETFTDTDTEKVRKAPFLSTSRIRTARTTTIRERDSIG